MDVTLGLGSLLGGIASGVGTYISGQNQLKATRETNAQNYKIWQEQMEHNVDMYEMQRNDNLDMYNLQRANNIADWRMQQEYNTASAQRQRLEEAGLNPYMMMNGGSAGVASSAPYSANMGSASVNPSQAPTMQTADPSAFIDPITKAVEGVISSFEGLNIGLNQGEQAQQTEATTPVIIENTQADTSNKNADTDKKVAETEGIKTDNKYKDLVNSVNYSILDKQDKLLADDVFMRNATLHDRMLMSSYKRMDMMLDVQTKSELLLWMPAEKAANLEFMAIQMAVAVQQGKMYESQAKAALGQYIASCAQAKMYTQQGNYYGALAKGQNLDNQVREFSLNDEKNSNKFFWQSQGEHNWFDYDSQLNFNKAYRFQNGLLSNSLTNKIGNDYGTKLYNNAVLSLKLSSVQFGADIEKIEDHGFSRWFGDAARAGLGGWFPMSAGYNVNYQQPQPTKPTKPIGFRP